ncbi:hypothetical protein S40293_03233 [Stachybotrys chartarum IBT 40293]|nr:hypothetical protein S40293_03233 [Stachybotrys chartarum IBT 40293]
MASSCCDSTECISGTVHKGLPIGTEETVHGLTTYITGNRTNPRGIIVIYSDVFGLNLPNNKLIADAYGKSGEWLVYMPDFFLGDPMALSIADLLIPTDPTKQSKLGWFTGLLAHVPSFLVWSTRHTATKSDKVCTEFLAELRRATPKSQKIGIVGFCWGGKYAVRACLASKQIEVDGQQVPLVDAAVALHPSHLSVPGDVEDLVVPVSFGWGVEDTVSRFEQKAKVEALHAQSSKEGKKVPEIEHKVYKPGRHGFAVRGNPDHPEERACLEDSVTQVLGWFSRWL